ncbi:ferrous iron transporter B, partial [Vibrio cholerae]|uniref:FeoB small GTPase domain-containing protein n=1 Tax=Vibrio cholerae TaxID=666 RepID=UPI00292A5C65
YMTLQLRELGRPMIVVLNKMDALKRERQVLSVDELEKVLGCPVVTLSATDSKQVLQFKEKLHKLLLQGVALNDVALDYGTEMEAAIKDLQPMFTSAEVAYRALAIRALESDTLVLNSLSEGQRNQVLMQKGNLELDIDLQVA